jgi:hypothetical protein
MNSTILRWIAPLAFLAIMLGGVGIAQATGQWITTGRQQVAAGQQLTPDDLRGWMTLQEAADGLGMPVADLIGLIGAPQGVALTGATAFKDLEALVPGFDLTAFREVVRTRLGRAANPTPAATAAASGTAAPTPAASTAPVPTGTTPAITGSMTLRQVAEQNDLDPAALVAQAGFPQDVGLDTPLKDLRASIPGFEIQTVRDAVAALR